MDIIAQTRALAAAIQKDKRYAALRAATAANEADKDLNELIGEFNLLRVKANQAAADKPADSAKVEAVNAEMQDCYKKILENENMKVYQAASVEMEALFKRITGILSMAVAGEDPETCEPPTGCGGSGCSGCEGCS